MRRRRGERAGEGGHGGDGRRHGAYFPAAVALCRLANVERPATGLRCAALPSAGSVQNLTDLRAGTVTLAFAQSDAAEAARAGTGAFAAAGPDEGLRSVMGLFPSRWRWRRGPMRGSRAWATCPASG